MGNFTSLFLLIAIFGIIWFFDRKNFRREGAFLLRRTTRWLKIVDSFAKKHSRFLEKYADAGVVASFGVLGIVYLAKERGYGRKEWGRAILGYSIPAALVIFALPGLFSGIISAFSVPAAYVSPILFGFKVLSFSFGLAGYSFFMLVIAGLGSTLTALSGVVPQSALKLVLPFSVPERYSYLPVQAVPIVPWLLSIFVILVAHEFSHAIVARREGIRVKSMGYGFFTILPLGFAEPDEKQIERAKSLKKMRIFAAGSWSNVVSAILILLLAIPLAAVFGLIQASSSFEAGVGYDRVDSNLTAAILPPEGVITEINGFQIHNYTEYQRAMARILPGAPVKVTINSTAYNLFSQADSENQSRAVLGFLSKDMYIKMELKPEKKGTITEYSLLAMASANTIVSYIIMLSVGIALANLLPIKPLDGGLMIGEAMLAVSKRRGRKIAGAISKIALLLLLYTLFGPLILKGLM